MDPLKEGKNGPKIKFKGKIKTDVNMWSLEFQSLNELLRLADMQRIRVNDMEFARGEVKSYYAVLDTIYNRLVPLTYDKIIVTMDLKLKRIENDILQWEKIGMKTIPLGIINQMKSFHRELYILRQAIGMGVPITREKTEITKMKNMLMPEMRKKYNEG